MSNSTVFFSMIFVFGLGFVLGVQYAETKKTNFQNYPENDDDSTQIVLKE